jgi:hypothetical protein
MKSDDGPVGKRKNKNRVAKRDFKDVYGLLDSDSDDSDDDSKKKSKKKKNVPISKGFDDMDDDDTSTKDTSQSKTNNSQKKNDTEVKPNLKDNSQLKANDSQKKTNDDIKKTQTKSPAKSPKQSNIEEADKKEIERLHTFNDTLKQSDFTMFITQVFSDAISFVEKGDPHEFFTEWKHDTAAPKSIRQVLRNATDENKDETITELKTVRDKYINYIATTKEDTVALDEKESKKRKDRVARAVDGPSDHQKLLEIFHGLRVYFDDRMNDDTKRLLKRYVVAYNGDVDTDCVNHVTTHVVVDNDSRGQKYLGKSYRVIDKKWITTCHAKQKRVPEEAFIIE